MSITDDSYKEVYGMADDDLYYYFWTGSGILKISKSIFEEKSLMNTRTEDGHTIDLYQYSSEDYRFINCFTSSIQEKDIKGQPIAKAVSSTAKVFIDSIEIPCIDILGEKCIMIKDLKRFGFQAGWDTEKRRVDLERADEYIDNNMTDNVIEETNGDTLYDVLYTDIRTFIHKDKHYYQIPPFNIDENTAISIGSLELLGYIVTAIDGDQIFIDVP